MMAFTKTFSIKFKQLKIRNKIIMFYLTLVLFSIGVSVFLYSQMSNDYLDETIYDLSISEIQSHNRSLEILIEDVNSYSKEIVSSPSIQTALDPNQQQTYGLKQVDKELAASMIFDNKISSVYIFDFTGKKYYRDKQIFKNIQLEEIMDKEWYQDLIDLSGGYMYNFNGDGLLENEELNYLSFFRIINSNVDHKPVGLMMINIEEQTLMDTLNVSVEDESAYILKEEQFHTSLTLNGIIPDKIQSKINDLDDNGSIYKEIEVDKVAFRFVSFTNSDYHWKILEIKPDPDRLDMISVFNLAMFVIILVNGGLVIYGSFVISAYITNPITELTISMKAVEDGTFIPVDVETYHDEIGNLKEGYNYMIIEIQELLKKVIEEQEGIKEAELRMLMEQIKPHFMYNTLDSISSLIMLGRSDEANDALSALAKFYRTSLSDGRTVVTLETEIEIIRHYLFIQNIRYRDLFTVSYDIDESLLGLKVPKLMLQPLVENCLIHGIRPMGMDGVITVKAQRINHKIRISVGDNGMGIAQKNIIKIFEEVSCVDENISSIGLPATFKRIKHMYGEQSRFNIDSNGDGTIISIELPDEVLNKSFREVEVIRSEDHE